MLNFIPTIMPWIWLGIVIACILVETFTFSLTTIWAAIAGIPMIFISKSSMSLKWQLLIFAVLTLVLLIATRPFAIKMLKTVKKVPNSLEGTEVRITKEIPQFEKGEAKTSNGVLWTAKSKDNTVIPQDTRCRITSVEGNTLIVEPLE